MHTVLVRQSVRFTYLSAPVLTADERPILSRRSHVSSRDNWENCFASRSHGVTTRKPPLVAGHEGFEA